MAQAGVVVMSDGWQKEGVCLKSVDERFYDKWFRVRESFGWVSRYEKALRMIAKGRISPAIGFARRVLDGQQPEQALKDEISARGRHDG